MISTLAPSCSARERDLVGTHCFLGRVMGVGEKSATASRCRWQAGVGERKGSLEQCRVKRLVWKKIGVDAY